MKTLSALWFSLRALLSREQTGADIDEELAFHLERETRMYEQSGMSPAEARREAARRFGGVQRYREECRDVRRVSWVTDFRSDVRFALRLARHHPGFSANVILISALGIAACVTTFSLVSGILLAPLTFPDQDRVFSLELHSAQRATAGIPTDTYLRLAAGSPVFDAVTTTAPASATVEVNGELARTTLGAVTASFFAVYRVRPFLGRCFTAEEVETRAPVVLLGYGEWMNHYGGDRDIVGRRITFDGAPHTIIGVMPPRFLGNFEAHRFPPAIWVPLRVERSAPSINLTMRLANGVSKERAEAWLATVARLKIESYQSTDSLPAVPVLVPVTEMIYGDVKGPLLILLGAVILVLVLVAANVATMFLARSAARASELAVRTALGATAGRQFRQLITESVTLTAIGGAVGLAVSVGAIRVVRSLGHSVLPRIDNVAVDWRVMLFAVAGIIVTGCVGGIAHTIASRAWQQKGMSETASTRVTKHRTSTALVLVQVALSVVLLVGAGLLVKGFMRVAPTNPGFALRNRATIALSLRGQPGRPATDWDANRRLVGDIIDRMRWVGGVQDVAMTSFLPLTGMASIGEVIPSGRSIGSERFRAYTNVITPNYFDVMDIPIKRGRAFTASDGAGAAEVAVINETAAARWWPGVNPIGQRLTLRGDSTARFITIVGMVRGSRMYGRETKMVPEMYTPLAQSHVSWVSLVAVTAGDPRASLPALRRAVHDAAPSIPITTATDLETTAVESVSAQRFYSVAMSLFAIAAVVLSALGVYGLLSFAVAQRMREIGIRMALGASSARIGRTVIGRALVIGVAGVGIGTAIAFALSRYMASLLTEVTATDRGVFTTAALVVFAVAVLAACAPTYQAVRVDPIKSLRT